MIDIRPVEPGEAATWLAMRVALWPDEAEPELRRDVEAYFTGKVQGLERVLVATGPEDQVIGFAELNIRPYAEGCVTERVAYLEGWYVEPGHRSRGVGGALVRAAEEWAVAQGCTEMASDTWEHNAASVAAHQALGFEPVLVQRCFRKRLGESAPPADATHALDRCQLAFSTMLAVRDLERSESFYVEKLGFRVTTRSEGYRRLDRIGVSLCLVTDSPPTVDRPGISLRPLDTPDRSPVNLVFWVTDVRAAHEALSRLGVVFLAPPMQPPWGGWRCFTRDPDGYLIELEQQP